MRLRIRSRNCTVSSECLGAIERRLRFVLGRFGQQIHLVTVDLAESNGSCSGMDKCCRIDAGLKPLGRVFVEVTDKDLDGAVNRAADRLAQAVDRDLRQRRETMGFRSP